MKASGEDHQFTYFQYFKQIKIPVYIRFNADHFDPDIMGLLKSMRFEEVTQQEVPELKLELLRNMKSRLLTINEAGPYVARQIEMIAESDRYGAESIIPHPGHNIYRYKGIGAMIYSFASNEWELGTFPDFGGPQLEFACRSIINRYLSWALAPLGYVGFWATPVEEAIVVMRQKDSFGEAVFMDVKKGRLLSVDGQKIVRSRFKIIKLDEKLSGENKHIRSEELLSYLSVCCTYFDYSGLSVPVRQMLQHMVKNYSGVLHPKESFLARSQLTA